MVSFHIGEQNSSSFKNFSERVKINAHVKYNISREGEFTSNWDGGSHQGKFCGSIGFKLVHTNGILTCGNGKEIHSRVNEENIVKPESFGFNLLTVGNWKF